jgi:hypothetical protein
MKGRDAHLDVVYSRQWLLVQDAANRSGGKWIIRLKKVVSGRFWEDLVLLYPTLRVGCGASFQCQDYIITALP